MFVQHSSQKVPSNGAPTLLHIDLLSGLAKTTSILKNYGIKYCLHCVYSYKDFF